MGSRRLAAEIPKITKAILFPKRSIAMKWDSSLKNVPKILPLIVPFDLSNSTFNRLEEMKAISIPEKYAEKISVIKIIKSSGSI